MAIRFLTVSSRAITPPIPILFVRSNSTSAHFKGKCLLLQLVNEHVNVKAINIPDFDIKNIVQYLETDSTHVIDKNLVVKIVDDTHFSINGKIITLLNDRDATRLNWRSLDVEYVIDTTGAYLTTDKCLKHDVDYVIMCAPPKDNSDQFVWNVNHDKYAGERIVSNASCTTNALTPVLRVLDDAYGVDRGAFTTIHSTTASQNTIDTNNFKNRTSRSVFNNIIPHSTGANKSVSKLLPHLKDRIAGTSLRVPVNNVSIVDLVITLKPQADGRRLTYEEVIATMEASGCIEINRKNLVSSDFNTTTIPSIVDYGASMPLPGDNEFKLMIWYDNEYSYCAQVIKLAMHMARYNEANNFNKHPNFIENHNFAGRNVVLRVDWNVPVSDAGLILDDYRITSSLKTIHHVLSQNPSKVVLVSHLGRPSAADCADPEKSALSWRGFVQQLQPYFEEPLHFLSKGVCRDTLAEISGSSDRLFLLENIRFHDEETKYAKMSAAERASSEVVQCFNAMGDFFVNDAFGCCHREHMSIVGMDTSTVVSEAAGGGGSGGTTVTTSEDGRRDKAFGFLIDLEVKCLEMINENKNSDRILAIVGGGKMKDKLELMKQLSKKVDGIYIAGGNVNSIYNDDSYSDYLTELKKNKAEVHLMRDGLAAVDLDSAPQYVLCSVLPSFLPFLPFVMSPSSLSIYCCLPTCIL
jgi:glyceraldehyde 3-phosphate dehydrogenase